MSGRRLALGRGARLIVSALVLAATGAGCSLIVTGDVPDFQCSGVDPSACPSGMSCDPTTNRCVSGEAGIGVVEAGEEDAPLGDGGSDGADAADGGPLALGSNCRVDSECKSRLCASSTILTATITASTGPICTTPCCNSTECAPSFVCFNGGTGGGYCVPAALAQRQPPPSGGKTGGALCATNSDCRSGLCTGSTKRCLDTCCTANECGGSTTCRVKAVAAPGASHDVWVCAPSEPGAVNPPGAACTTNAECSTDACIGFGSQQCRPSCSSTASCRMLSGFEQGHCFYTPSNTDYVKLCAPQTNPADLPAGSNCTDKSECQSDYCDAALKKCANVCGRDSDCASNEACRPSGTGTPFLRCGPKL
jgi:hypothetical protein